MSQPSICGAMVHIANPDSAGETACQLPPNHTGNCRTGSESGLPEKPSSPQPTELIELLESCADDREQEAHRALNRTPEAFDAFMDDARLLRAHAALLRGTP